MLNRKGFTAVALLLIGAAIALAVSPVLALAVDAAPAAVNPVGDSLAGLLEKVIWPVLGAFLTGLIGLLLTAIRTKTGLQISAERQAQLEQLALQGIHLAEEKAAAAVKAGATKLTGSNKLDMAISHIIAMAPTVTPEFADTLVHAALGSAWGVGASTTPGGIIASSVSSTAAL